VVAGFLTEHAVAGEPAADLVDEPVVDRVVHGRDDGTVRLGVDAVPPRENLADQFTGQHREPAREPQFRLERRGHKFSRITAASGAGLLEKLASQYADVGLVGEQSVDAGQQEGDLLVERLAVRGRVRAHPQVPRLPSAVRGMIWFLSGPMPLTKPDSSCNPAGVR
jgi:hypothetical protein